MRYLSLFSGIEAASQAWTHLGWTAAAFAEIESFPAAVLAHHYPDVPNLGDVNKHKEWPDIGTIDLICGGSPCQSFSVAGLRKGMDDPRGNLALVYLSIVNQYRPSWIVYENVPGLLSSNGGRDFGSFLGGLGQLGYGFAYRVLDAQFVRVGDFPFAVPQRRRRVFVVGYLGDWRRAAAVLFDAESLSGNPPPRREAGKSVALTISARPTGGGGLGTDFDLDGGLIAQDCAPTLNAHFGDKMGLENQHINGGCGLSVAHALRGEGFDASEDGTGRGTPIVPVAYRTTGNDGAYETGNVASALTTATDPNSQVFAFSAKDYGGDAMEECSPTLRAGGHSGSHANAGVMPAVAFDLNQITSKTNRSQPDPAVHHTLPAASCPPHLATPWAVRRLTPKECSRLQGFPDDFARIPYRGKPADKCPDGPQYKSYGNSMAVNVMSWIGERIAMIEAMP